MIWPYHSTLFLPFHVLIKTYLKRFYNYNIKIWILWLIPGIFVKWKLWREHNYILKQTINLKNVWFKSFPPFLDFSKFRHKSFLQIWAPQHIPNTTFTLMILPIIFCNVPDVGCNVWIQGHGLPPNNLPTLSAHLELWCSFRIFRIYPDKKPVNTKKYIYIFQLNQEWSQYVA